MDMSDETARRAIDFATEHSNGNAGIIFFGGEPLIKKDLIAKTLEYCHDKQPKNRCILHFKVSTNGLLLDKEFLLFAEKMRLAIALSVDGIQIAHDAHRMTSDGKGTFEDVEDRLRLLLKYQPYAIVLMTVNPDTVEYYFESVKMLFEKGVKYLVTSLNYAGQWCDENISELKRQYKLIANLYKKLTIDQKKFYFSPFDMKFSSHIRGDDERCFRCHLGLRQVSVAPDGSIYPCVQFVKDGISNKKFIIGNVSDGFDEKKRNELYEMSREKSEQCSSCALVSRCNHDCSCLNWQTTGLVNRVSSTLCETERAIFPIADKLGEQLYARKAPMFIQKHYNAVYPILSLFDDMT